MAINKLVLPRLTKGWNEQPQLLERYWDIAMKRLEETLNQLLDLPIIEQALIDLDIATQAAQTAADNANAAADSVTSETSLVNSYPSSFVSPLVSANSSGDVTIANHNRVYGDSVMNPTVAVTGNIVATGAAVGSIVRIYYNDSTRSGGAVTYLFTVDPAAPPVQTGNTHSIGAVEIPAAGSVDGGYVRPPGYSDIIP